MGAAYPGKRPFWTEKEAFAVAQGLPRCKETNHCYPERPAMPGKRAFKEQSVHDIISEAVRRERENARFYEEALPHVSYDAHSLFTQLLAETQEHMRLLGEKGRELMIQKKMTEAMAD
jgi:rubrerythrin